MKQPCSSRLGRRYSRNIIMLHSIILLFGIIVLLSRSVDIRASPSLLSTKNKKLQLEDSSSSFSSSPKPVFINGVSLPKGNIFLDQQENNDSGDGGSDDDEKAIFRTATKERNLALNTIDPSAYIIKFQDCTLGDDNVLLEVCFEYRNTFMESCGTYLVDFHTWVKFKDDFIFQRMLSDYCKVCQECDPDNKWDRRDQPYDICNLQVWDYHEDVPNYYCNTYCDYDSGKPTPEALVANCYGDLGQNYKYTESCIDQQNRRRDRHKLSEVALTTKQNVDHDSGVDSSSSLTGCFLSEWFDEWIESCDEHGYPNWSDDVAYPKGNAYLRCSLLDNDDDMKEEDGDNEVEPKNPLCTEFYKTLQFCHQATNTRRHKFDPDWHPRGTIKASAESCLPYNNGGDEIGTASTTSISNKPNPAKEEDDNYIHIVIDDVKASYTTKHLYIVFVVGCILGGLALRGTQVVIHGRRRRRTESNNRIYSSSLILLEEYSNSEGETRNDGNRNNNDDPSYHRVVEMNDLSLQL